MHDPVMIPFVIFLLIIGATMPVLVSLLATERGKAVVIGREYFVIHFVLWLAFFLSLFWSISQTLAMQTPAGLVLPQAPQAQATPYPLPADGSIDSRGSL